MRKIPTLFVRDWEGDRSRVLDIVTPGCEWVIQGEGIATRKYDGTCCLIRDGKLYKRHEVRGGKDTPTDFELVEETTDPDGKVKLVGWVPVGEGPEDRWHREALDEWRVLSETIGSEMDPPRIFEDGTYELLGPKIQGNPEGFPVHALLAHADAEQLWNAPCDYAGLKDFLADWEIEGIVWHHEDGRMAKIKGKDFGLKR